MPDWHPPADRRGAERPAGGRGCPEIAHALHLAPASAHRLLSTLLQNGLVRRHPESARYHIGAESFRIALKLTTQFGIHDASLPIMRGLVEESGEIALLSYYDAVRMELMYIASVNSNHPLRYVVALNEWIPVYAGAERPRHHGVPSQGRAPADYSAHKTETAYLVVLTLMSQSGTMYITSPAAP